MFNWNNLWTLASHPYTMGSHTFKGATTWLYLVERDRPGEYAVNHVHCVLDLGRISNEWDKHKETRKRVRRWTNKTLAQRTKQQDSGSMYKTVMSKESQAVNEGQDPGSTHIVAKKGTSDSRSKAWLWIVTCYLVSTAPRSTLRNIRSSSSSEMATNSCLIAKRKQPPTFRRFPIRSSPRIHINAWYKQVIPCLLTGFTVNILSNIR